MYNLILKNIETGEYDTPDTTELHHKGDIIVANGERWLVIGGKVLPRKDK